LDQISRDHPQILLDMLAQLPQPIIFTDTAGIIVGWLGAAEQVFGYSAEEAVGRPVDFLHQPQIKAWMTESIIKEMRETGRFKGEIPCLGKDGREVLVEITSWTVNDESGQPAYLVSINRDITEDRRMERALRQSEENYHTLARNFPNGAVFLFDKNLRYILADGKGLEDIGFTRKAIEGRTVWEVFPPDDAETLAVGLRKALAGESHSMEVPYGDKIYLRHTLPVKDDQGNIFGGMVVTQDITGLKRFEENLSQARDALEKTANERTVALVEANRQLEEKIGELNFSQTQLRHSEERYRSLVETSFQWVFITNPAGDLVSDMPGWRVITGQSQAELLGRGWTTAVHPEDLPQVNETWNHSVETRTIFETEYRIRKYDGTYRFIAANAVPVLEGDGNIREWVGTCDDITTQKEVELNQLERLQLLAQIATEQAKLIGVIQQMPVGVSIAEAPGGRTILTNRLVQEILGDSFVPPKGTGDYLRFRGFFADGRPIGPTEWPMARALLKGETVSEEEVYFIREDGEGRYISVNAAPVYDTSGQLIMAVSTFYDMSERKQLENGLREQTETVETINRAGQVLSAELDLHKLIQATTDAGTEMTGAEFGVFFYNHTDENGESSMLYALSGVAPEAFAGFPIPRKTALFGPTFQGHGVIRLADVRLDSRFGQNPPYYGMLEGHLPVVSYMAVPVILRSGEVLGGLFFGHSKAGVFTERHERLLTALGAQTAIAMDNARLYQEAQAAIRQRDEFLSIAAHELKTPLTSLRGFVQHTLRQLQLKGEIQPDKLINTLQTVNQQAVKLSQLVTQLLDVSRLQSGKLPVAPVQLDLTALFGQVVENFRSGVTRHELIFQVGPGEVQATVDPLRIEQVLNNLLDNAIKFSPEGGRVTVELARLAPGRVRLAVTDQGIGIPEEYRANIFDRFFQAHSNNYMSGMGLGLYLTRQIIELHGGTITAEFPEEGGTRFVINLPVNPGS
jgi:PAS domain S-box-containing protein